MRFDGVKTQLTRKKCVLKIRIKTHFFKMKVSYNLILRLLLLLIYLNNIILSVVRL